MTTTANFERSIGVLGNADTLTISNALHRTNRARQRIQIRWGYRSRLLAVVALVAIAYGSDYVHLVGDALAGSRTPLLALTPLFALLVATGYRRPPDGVNDNESDWLFVAILGIIGFAGIALVTARFEALAAVWRLDLMGAVLWAVCASVILLGARHTQRMWRVWLFAAISATPVPVTLAAGALGGSDTANVAVSVCFGATAVYLAGARAPRPKRLLAAAASLALGWLTATLLIDALPLFGVTAIAALGVPVLVHVGMRRWIGTGADTGPLESYPARSWRSLLALPVLALVVGFAHTSAPTATEPPVVQGDWVRSAGLFDARELTDVQHYLGGDADYVRYAVPAGAGMPAAAVDVITMPSLAALHDHHSTVWYPTTRPLNFTAAPPLTTGAPVEVRAVYSNADTAIDSTTPHWYALTWDWHSDAGYQRVTVVVNQDTAGGEPPAPQPMTVTDTLVNPALWIGRQQAEGQGRVDDLVVRRATEVADSLLAHLVTRA